MDPTQLATRAREAYEQKRTRDCLAMTKRLALADPGNAEAAALQSAIRADMQRDLEDARGLIQESAGDDEKKKYRKAAEIILRKTLNIDPENEEAKLLLQSIRSLPPEPRPDSRLLEHPKRGSPLPDTRDEIEFVAAPALEQQKPEKKKGRLKLPVALVAIVVVGGALLLRQQSSPTQTNAMASVARPEAANNFSPRSAGPQNTPAAAPDGLVPVGTIPPPADPAKSAGLPPANQVGALSPATTPPPEAVVPAPDAMGKLAISSPVAAEIYMGDRYLGSTPITLQLPAGRQTLEYRRGNLRTVVNHDVKADKTTAASVTFRVTVQINARPWAQVFLGGNSRQSLGQTPLSGVSVPIGGVLVFENPNFTSKSYRVTEKDTAIQVDFP